MSPRWSSTRRQTDWPTDWPSVAMRLWLEPTALFSTCFHAGFSLGLFFDPENGGDMFLRNVGCPSTDYTALYPRRLKYLRSIFLPFTPLYTYKCSESRRKALIFLMWIRRGADKSLAFPISYLQPEQKNFSWMGFKKVEQRSQKCVELRVKYVE
jgi:hypothetical protein